MFKRFLPYFATFAIVAGAGLAWLERDSLFDMWRLRNYEAPAEIARLAEVTTMSPDAKRLFYVYHPSLEDKSAFNAHCANAERTIVLGCYIEHHAIYLYNVPDPRLSGVIEVTASHELLHAAYDRLSTEEKTKVDRMINDAAQKITDERLKETIENYRKKDPNIVPNELHSILGTELRDLPDELEQYYSKYFANRKAVVDFADKYKKEFIAREQQVVAMDAQLARIKTQIDELNGQLEREQSSLKSQFEAMQGYKQSGRVERYNQEVPVYNQSVSAYNASVNRQKQLILQYNQLVEQRNELAVEENELSKALDSRAPIQAQ